MTAHRRRPVERDPVGRGLRLSGNFPRLLLTDVWAWTCPALGRFRPGSSVVPLAQAPVDSGQELPRSWRPSNLLNGPPVWLKCKFDAALNPKTNSLAQLFSTRALSFRGLEAAALHGSGSSTICALFEQDALHGSGCHRFDRTSARLSTVNAGAHGESAKLEKTVKKASPA